MGRASNGGCGGSSRKHHTKHNRSKSNYPKRLRARGLSTSPRMTPLEDLRRRARYDADSESPLARIARAGQLPG